MSSHGRAGFQNARNDSLPACPITRLQLLGLRHRRYTAPSAWQSRTLIQGRGLDNVYQQRTSRCSSPMPEMIVCALSLSRCTRNVGSSF